MLAKCQWLWLLPWIGLESVISTLLKFSVKLFLLMTGLDPKSRFPTLYQVILEQNAQTADLDALIKGIRIRDKVYKVKSAAYIQGGSKKEIGIEASNLSPGLLKKILEQRSLKALSMDRVLLAGLTKKDLPRGRWRSLTDKEIQFLNMIS